MAVNDSRINAAIRWYLDNNEGVGDGNGKVDRDEVLADFDGVGNNPKDGMIDKNEERLILGSVRTNSQRKNLGRLIAVGRGKRGPVRVGEYEPLAPSEPLLLRRLPGKRGGRR